MTLRFVVFVRSFMAAGLLASLLALPACGGGGDPPEQTRPTQVQLVGTATDGTTLSTAATVKGTAGIQRTSTAVAGTTTYAVLLDQLTAPYMVQAGSDYSVALGAGNANATPLTDLVVSVLFGQDAASAYNGFGPTTPSLTGRATAANIAAAQAATIAFLRDKLGLVVPASVGDFIATPFSPTAGDPMYDLVVALQSRRAALGDVAYGSLVGAFVNHARLCIAESVSIGVGGSTQAFCPATKTATPEDADSTIVDYVFTTDTGDVLTVRARDASVLDASYAPAGGTDAYTCSAAACTGIVFGTPAADLTRTLTFGNTALSSAGGAATVAGTLVTAIPGVALPVLPCSDNRFFLIGPDRSVVADCVNISDGANLLGLPGTSGATQGTTSTTVYRFQNSDGSNGLPSVDSPTAVYVTIDGSAVVSIDAVHRTTDPDTGVTRIDSNYKCRAAACNGATVGAPVVNTDFGFSIEIRTITLDNTTLSAVNADGSLSATLSATLKGSFTGLYISNDNSGAFVPPAPDSCDGFQDKVLTTPVDESFVFPSCVELSGGTLQTTVLDDNDLQLQLSNFGYGDVTVTTASDGSTVKSVFVAVPTETYGCAADCSGVAVSAPDADGNRTVTLDSTLLHIVEPDGFPTGARTATSTGTFIVPPPQPAPMAAPQRSKARREPRSNGGAVR